jgi:hypothetical protein
MLISFPFPIQPAPSHRVTLSILADDTAVIAMIRIFALLVNYPPSATYSDD